MRLSHQQPNVCLGSHGKAAQYPMLASKPAGSTSAQHLTLASKNGILVQLPTSDPNALDSKSAVRGLPGVGLHNRPRTSRK